MHSVHPTYATFSSWHIQLQSLMTPLCPSYVKWDSHWRPVGKLCITLGTLESMLPWIGSWAIWMTQVCRAVRFLPESQFSMNLVTPLTPTNVLLLLIGCRLCGPPGVAGLQLRARDHTHWEPLWGAPGNHCLNGLQPRPGNQSTSGHG